MKHEMITVVVPTKNTKKDIPCTKCFKCEHPIKENKCGKFKETLGDKND